MDYSELAKAAMYSRIAKALDGAVIFDAHDRDAGTMGWVANWLTFGGNVSVSGKRGETREMALANLAGELHRQFTCTAEELKK